MSCFMWFLVSGTISYVTVLTHRATLMSVTTVLSLITCTTETVRMPMLEDPNLFNPAEIQ